MQKLLRLVGIFFATALLLIGCLIAAVTIPRSAIEKKAAASAEFLAADPAVFHYQVPDAPASIRDQYADANLLNIAYYFDPKRPLYSIVWDYYYWGENITANLSFLEAVRDNPPPNMEYLRYWHGSLAIVRPLLMFMSIDQIYILHAFILAALFAFLMWLLLKNRFRLEAVSLIISLVMVNVWFVPLCLEYYWMFLVMFLSSIAAVKLAADGKFEYLDYLFLITGIVAAYLDFLTVEIITALIPLLLSLSIGRRRGWFIDCGVVSPAAGKENGKTDGKVDVKAVGKADVNSEKTGAALKNGAVDARTNTRTNALTSGRISARISARKTVLKWLVLWGIGFVAMWLMKWVMASAYIGRSVEPYLRDNTMLHLGLKSHISKPELILRGWLKNFFALAPFEYGIYGGIALFLFILFFVAVPVFRNTVRLKSRIDWNCIRLYLVIGMLPYIRYMLLPTHSSHHYFFTHRAQAATILALCFIVRELVEKTPERSREVTKSRQK